MRIDAGDVGGATVAEVLRLGPDEVTRGMRLACQVKPRGDVRLTLLGPLSSVSWRPIPAADLPSPPPLQSERARRGPPPLGAAVDLGTTHISLTLWDLDMGVRLAVRTGLNPQCAFGSDVMTRLTTACSSRRQAAEMGRVVRDAIGDAMLAMVGEGCRLADIGRVVIVGNTAMLALLADKNHDLLLKPACWNSPIDCRPTDVSSWCRSWGIHPQAHVEVVPPMAGFVGSDLLAGVLATRLTEGTQRAVLMDFGTNSELALWDGETLRVTAAAGGPAFEGCGIGCGMPAGPGAIYRLELTDSSPSFRYELLGNGEARGVCGSGLVDVIAGLRRIGLLNSRGRFAPGVEQGLPIVAGSPGLRVTGRDVDAFQRAKAAIGAGTRFLMRDAATCAEDLGRVCVGGAFGRFLNVENAQSIGLLPEVPVDRVELCGNSALAGAEILLLSPGSSCQADELRRKAHPVNLAQVADFENLYVENLHLRPLRPGA